MKKPLGDTRKKEMENQMRIKIDGVIYNIKNVTYNGCLTSIETETGEEFYLAKNHEEAGEKARKYWEDLAQDDPEEFACMVGVKVLINWGLGISDGPGTTAVSSQEEWLDLWLDTPEEEWATYDMVERTVNRVGTLVNDLGFKPTVAYRSN